MDRDPILERLGGRFLPPADPLEGVIERRRRRNRNRRIAGGTTGVALAAALSAALLVTATMSGDVATVSPAASEQSTAALGPTGLRVAIPPSWTTFDSVDAYQRFVVHNGGWGLLGQPACWGQRQDFARRFVGAAFLDDTPGPSEPTRRLLVLRTADRSLDALAACETDLRVMGTGRLMQRASVQVDGHPGMRLVFSSGSYHPGRFVLLYVVDGGAYRWAFEFTVAGVQPGAMHLFDSIMLLTVRFPPG